MRFAAVSSAVLLAVENGKIRRERIQYTAHGRDLEFAGMDLHKGVLHFRLLPKYAMAFFYGGQLLGLLFQPAIETGIFQQKPLIHDAFVL